MFERKSFSPSALLIVLLAGLVAFFAFGLLRVGPAPDITIRPAVQAIGKRTPIKIEVAEPAAACRTSRSSSSRATGRSPSPKNPTPSRLLKPGERGRSVTCSIWKSGATRFPDSGRARPQSGSPRPEPEPGCGRRNRRFTRYRFRCASRPRRYSCFPARPTWLRADPKSWSTELGEGSVRDGVQSGDWWFPGYPLPGGGKQDRFAIFAIPYDMAEPRARLIADDGAGNQAEVSFIDKFFPKAVKQDRIEVSDAFLGKVVPEILSQSPEIQDKGKLLDNYLEINRSLRQKNTQQIRDLAAKTQPAFLWTRTFVGIPNGKVMAAFADRRTYFYQGNKIDQQDHLGYDLAVTTHAPVPAANDGVVLQARFFGIYGNCVVLDHGYGLMSLYGHLASIAVKEGQKVARGDVLGATGQTGLAGGDHLHFTTLLQGLPVNPVEWWDSHWIQDRVAKKLGPAFKFEP